MAVSSCAWEAKKATFLIGRTQRLCRPTYCFYSEERFPAVRKECEFSTNWESSGCIVEIQVKMMLTDFVSILVGVLTKGSHQVKLP